MQKTGWVRSVIALLCSACLIPFNAFAWSVEAHQTIALIAMKRLTGTSTANRIATILGTLTLEDIAVCPDQVRELEAKEIKKLSAPCAKIFSNPPTGTEQWHFVNTPVKGADFTPSADDVNAACKDVCAVVQIQRFLDVLSSSSPTDAGVKKTADQQALSFVVHFIGDIHQPLHSADRNGDAGGNAEHVKFFNDSNVALHAIWDNQIVAKIDSTPAQLAADLSPEIAAAAAQSQGQPMDWTLEAYIPARDVAYQGIPPSNGNTIVATLAQPYQDAAAPVVRTQIARAGVRLAAALKNALP
jgi:nuclease S1